MKKIGIAIIGTLFSCGIYAQDYQDVLRYSESFPQGNARFSAMSGAFGGLGANISGMSINPAGSAMFNKSVFEFSPAFNLTKSENYYLNTYDRAFVSTLKIPNVGVVFSKPISQNDLYVTGISYGFSVNRQNQFNETTIHNAINNTSSLTDEFVRLSNQGIWFEDFNGLAEDTKIIGYDSTNSGYFSDFRYFNNSGEVETDYGQNQTITNAKEGAKKEYLFNFGVDFSEKVFIGADVSIESIFYSQNFSIIESDDALTKDYLNNYTYATSLKANGSGVSAKFGVITKPIEYIRLGVAVHSPTMYSINEEYSSKIQAYYDREVENYTDYYARETFNIDYTATKPGKFIGSLGFVYKNIAMIGMDYESVNYAYGYLSSKTESMTNANLGINENLTRAENIKIGAELRYGPFSFRGGIANYGNPYKKFVATTPYYRTDVSGGVGISNDRFYCDMSWVKSNKKVTNTLYSDYSNTDVTAKSNIKTDNVMLTVGFKF